MQIYINVKTHKCRYTQMQIYTNVDKHVDVHTCRYTQMQIYTNVDIHKCR